MATQPNATELLAEKVCEKCGAIYRLRSTRLRSKFNKQRYCSRLCTARAAVKARDPERRVVPMEIGSRWGLWTILKSAGRGYWYTRCDCGTTAVIDGRSIRCGNSGGCGCQRPDPLVLAKRNVKHGMRNTREYAIWSGIKARCRNPFSSNFVRYGARGIDVCEKWFESFEAFYADMGPRPSPKHSIDRIDNDGPYAPGNCRWAMAAVQNNNRGPNRR